jgi:Na+/melibiose symporter-like transporter
MIYTALALILSPFLLYGIGKAVWQGKLVLALIYSVMFYIIVMWLWKQWDERMNRPDKGV